MNYSVYTSVILVNSTLDILLCRRKDKKGFHIWTTPTKIIEEKECIKDSIVRCLYQDTNVTPLAYSADGYIENIHDDFKEIILFFICEEYNNIDNLKSNHTDDTVIEYKWVSLQDLPPDIDNNLYKYLNDIHYYG